MVIKKIFVKLKLIARRKARIFFRIFPRLNRSVGFLEQARTCLKKGDFASALEYYCLEKSQAEWNLEPRIGISICHIQLENWGDALKTLREANSIFGDHDAILGLITKCNMHEKSWGDVEIFWSNWRKSLPGCPTLDFYHTTGEILISLLKAGGVKRIFLEKLIADLVFQDDRSIDSRSHPVLCSLLFLQHEYNRPLYLQLIDCVSSFLTERKVDKIASSLCVASILLTFGLVSKEERKVLLESHFYDFDLYSHWSFVLLGSAWEQNWDESLKVNADSIRIVHGIVQDAARNLDVYGFAQIYKLIFLANVCCRELIPTLIEHARKALDQNKVHDGFRDDLAFIVQKYERPKNSQQKKGEGRLKIAICVSGQLRGWKHAFRSWQQIGIVGHDVTYVVHTWKDTGGGPPFPPKDERVLPADFQNEFRKIWNRLGQEEMLSRYSNFFSLWPQKGAEIEVDDLKCVYGTEHVYIDDDLSEPFLNFSNSEKMYYKIWECQRAADKLGVDFDLIVRIRPDLEFISYKDIDWSRIYSDCTRRGVLFCESHANYFFPNIGFCMPDQFAIASPGVMRGYANAYSMTKRHPEWDGLGLTNFPQDFIAHRNAAYATLYNGAVVEAIGLPCRFSPAFKPSNEMMKEAILRDAIGRNDSLDELLLNSL